MNTLDHSGTWFIPMILALLFTGFGSVLMIWLKGSITEMKEDIKEILTIMGDLQTGRQVNAERIAVIHDNILRLERIIEIHESRLQKIEKEHNYNHHKENQPK
jgi:hypothetical protein